MVDLDTELKRLVSSAVLVFFGTAFGAGSKLLERVIIGRLLSVDVYGEVSVLLSVVTVSVIVSLFGFTKGIPRYISRTTDMSEKRGIWWSGVVVSTLIAVVVTAVLLLQSELLFEYVLDGLISSEAAQLLLLSTPFIVGIRLVVAGIRGMETTTYRIVVNDFFYPVLRIGIALALLLGGAGAVAVGQAYLVSSVAAFALGVVLFNRLFPIYGRIETNVPELLRFSFPLLLSSIFAVLLLKTDTLLIGLLSTSFEVGLYNAAYPLANGMIVILSAFGYLYLPVASRLDSNSERESMERVYQVTTKWIIVITFPLLAVFLVYPGGILTLLFGPDYRPAALSLVVLAGGFFVNAVFGRNVETLSALGDTRSVFVGNALGFAFNVCCNILVIPVYGIEGAAVVSALSFTLQNLYVNWILWRYFGIKPFTARSSRLFVALPAALLVVRATDPLVSLTTMTAVPVFAFATVTTLCSITVFGCFEEEDLLLVGFLEEKAGLELDLVRRIVEP